MWIRDFIHPFHQQLGPEKEALSFLKRCPMVNTLILGIDESGFRRHHFNAEELWYKDSDLDPILECKDLVKVTLYPTNPRRNRFHTDNSNAYAEGFHLKLLLENQFAGRNGRKVVEILFENMLAKHDGRTVEVESVLDPFWNPEDHYSYPEDEILEFQNVLISSVNSEDDD
jgi:hypothetical protein